MAQERVQKQRSEKASTQETTVDETTVDATNAELAEDVKDTLDSIEDVLEDQDDLELLADLDEVLGTEEEAQAMVAEFVQQGGE